MNFYQKLISIAAITSATTGTVMYTQEPELSQPITQCTIFIADLERGVVESGYNTGYEVDQYLLSTGNQPGQSWCASFVIWSLKQCNKPTDNATAWSPSLFPLKRRIAYSDVKQGDVYGLWSNSKQRIIHVGLIYETGSDLIGDYVITIEGNTNLFGSTDGDGVYRKKRYVKAKDQFSRW